ncbi:DUF1275 family protein [Novosphingobium sp.]|uniref:YoaK family protein n=1 Tax=Novosphingobium sp. TaxID=1874826 RepID=UPI0025D8AD86|nr:DUF1275 family protein [Novosphingobium sp.]
MQSYDPPRQALAIASAALAGSIDAAGYLSANRYFVSFMSGNTTRLGVDLATTPGSAIMPVLLIGGFVAGVVGGSLVSARAGDQRKFAVLAAVALLLAGAALANLTGSGNVTLALLVLAMGAINNTFQRDGGVAVGVTYMTGALVRLGQGIAARISGTGGEGWVLWFFLWLGLALGAVAGAMAWLRFPELMLWLAALWAGALSIAARRLPRA